MENNLVASHDYYDFQAELTWFQVLRRLPHILRLAHIPPIIFIRSEGEDSFPLGCQTQIGRDDRERALFDHHFQKTRRNHVNAGESQCFGALGRSNQLGVSVASRSPSAKLKLLVEEEI